MTWIISWLLVIVVGILLFIVGLYTDTDATIGWGCVLFFVGLIAVVLLALNAEDAEHARLMRQCMDAGLPEYECVSKLRQNYSPVIVPMVVR